ncbi:unnamed protein product [Pieris macdunnoughi]|uniref:Uncharacterized protein n=1 Tax=Pieris macdunnoughi TaxID=345717 RepID=A0A821WM60_9NEOP|nr:unnamed protein product [Pieris macdunnoughi]
MHCVCISTTVIKRSTDTIQQHLCIVKADAGSPWVHFLLSGKCFLSKSQEMLLLHPVASPCPRCTSRVHLLTPFSNEFHSRGAVAETAGPNQNIINTHGPMKEADELTKDLLKMPTTSSQISKSSFEMNAQVGREKFYKPLQSELILCI